MQIALVFMLAYTAAFSYIRADLSLGGAFMRALHTLVLGADIDDPLREDAFLDAYFEWFFELVFAIVIVLLLTNLLIAMFSQTFAERSFAVWQCKAGLLAGS